MLDDIYAYLISTGHGTDQTLFKGRHPDEPDACIILYQYSGRAPVFTHDSPQPELRYPRLQVMVRDPDADAARAKAEAVYTALGSVVNATLGSRVYKRIQALQEPFELAADSSGRTLVACNYEITY